MVRSNAFPTHDTSNHPPMQSVRKLSLILSGEKTLRTKRLTELLNQPIIYNKDRGKTREGAWPRAPRALRSAAIPPIYYFWGEPRYARAHPRPDGLFLLPHTPSTCDSAPVGRHVRNRGESACSSASRSATGGHGKPRRTRPVPDHPVRGFSTAA